MSRRRHPLTTEERRERAKKVVSLTPCPTCGADPGAGCLTYAGLERTVHPKRVDAWYGMKRGRRPAAAPVKIRKAQPLTVFLANGEVHEVAAKILRAARKPKPEPATYVPSAQERWMTRMESIGMR